MAGRNLLADQDTEQGKNLLRGSAEEETSPEGAVEGSLLDNYVEGFKSNNIRDVNSGIRGGELLMEDTARRAGFGDMVEESRRGDKFEQWQPLIWDAQDRMDAIEDKSSPQYQIAYENVQNLKRNMRDDLEGNLASDTNFSMSDMVDMIKDNPGFALGSLTSQIMMDPALLAIPGGWKMAGARAAKATTNMTKAGAAATKLAAEVSGAAAVAGGFTGAEDMLVQLDENPDKPIDFDRVANSTVFGASFGGPLPIIPAATKIPLLRQSLSKAGNLWDARKIQKIEQEAQKIFNASMVDGEAQITKQLAVDKAIAKFNPLPETKEKLSSIDAFMHDDVLGQVASEAAAKKGPAATVKKFSMDKVDALTEGWNHFTQPITSRLRNMGYPHIAKALNEHDMNLGTTIHQRQEIAKQFSEQFGRLSKSQQQLAAINLNNGTFKSVADQFDQPFKDSLEGVTKLLDNEYNEMIDVGMDVTKIDNYFPRTMDYARYAEDNGISMADINRELATKINAKLNLSGDNKLPPSKVTPELIDRHLSADEVAGVIQRKIATKTPPTTVKSSTDNVKHRTIEEVTPDLMKYYQDPRAALHDHINRNTVKIHDRRFFGGKKIDDVLVEGNVSRDQSELTDAIIRDNLTQQMNEGKISPDDWDKLHKILQARFVGAKQPTHPIIGRTKNLLYALTLGNPIAASVQLGDMGAAAYMNNYKHAVNGIIGKAGKDVPRFSMDEFGLEHIPEIETMGATQKILDWSLKAGGFKAMDRLGKETILNSTYRKLRGVMDDPKLSQNEKFKYFKDRYGERLGADEVQKIMDGVASGDKTNHHARLAMYSDLTKVQPISISEMPVAYLNHPNARIAYMLKTFTMKQIDLMRQDVIKEIRQGVKNKDKKQIASGAMNMAKILGTIGAANTGVEWTKRWIAGEERDLPDVAISTVLRNYGLSQYTFDKVSRGDLSGALIDTARPPTQTIERAVGELMGADSKGRWVDIIPVAGRTYRGGVESGVIPDVLGTGLKRKR